MPSHRRANKSLPQLADLQALAADYGFADLKVTGIDLHEDEARLAEFLAAGFHGSMQYLETRFPMRARPAEFVAGTVSVICVRMDYLTEEHSTLANLLDHPTKAYVARYALGRDYHKLMRKRLAKFAQAVSEAIGPFGYRACVDSAPIMEKPLARNAGIGWLGKHTNVINKDAGSWFFLGELLTDLPLSHTSSAEDHCGTCTRCLDVCPTKAIVAPYQLDARRCISYLTIENRDSIPVEFREAIGNRVFGCDDCQIFCPWNKFAQHSDERDFAPRHGLDDIELTELFGWTEAQWEERTRGSAIRRIGYQGWLRNIAVALGNSASSEKLIGALRTRMHDPSELVREHVVWALEQHEETNTDAL